MGAGLSFAPKLKCSQGPVRTVNVTGWGIEGTPAKISRRLWGRGNSQPINAILRNVRLESPPTIKGLGGAIAGAGFIDAAFQGLGDFLSGGCFSPEQYAWRMLIAFEFGLITGIIGGAATVLAVAVGVPLLAAAATGFVVSLLVSEVALKGLKSDY